MIQVIFLVFLSVGYALAGGFEYGKGYGDGVGKTVELPPAKSELVVAEQPFIKEYAGATDLGVGKGFGYGGLGGYGKGFGYGGLGGYGKGFGYGGFGKGFGYGGYPYGYGGFGYGGFPYGYGLGRGKVYENTIALPGASRAYFVGEQPFVNEYAGVGYAAGKGIGVAPGAGYGGFGGYGKGFGGYGGYGKGFGGYGFGKKF